jgi:hypothetical protein
VRARLLALVLVAGSLGLSACGPSSDAEKRVRAALKATESLSRSYLYTETFTDKAGPRETTVRGFVEDDFRYKARVAVDGRPTLDESVSDDALAVRFLDPTRIGDFLRRPKKQDKGASGLGSADGQTAARSESAATRPTAGPTAAELLPTHRWVLDPAGAPAVVGAASADRAAGSDPVLDSLDVLAYVERAIGEADRIVEFNEDSLEYKPREDPFEHPKKGSGVVRYDFEAPKLPKASQTANGNQVTPDVRHFRKLSVYVKGGRVVQVLEKVDVAARLKDLAEIYDTRFPANRSPDELAVIATEALNAIRQGQGQDPVRLRTMEYKLADLGGEVKVDMPTDTTTASLALLENRGRAADAAAGTAEAAALSATLTAPPAG